MEFSQLVVLTLFCLAVVGSHASLPAEDYWQALWPNTPMPVGLRDLLLPAGEENAPKLDDTQYPTIMFFEHDLHPGRQMNMHFNRHTYSQPYGVWAYLKDPSKIDHLDKHTLEWLCEKRPAVMGEDKYCAKSLESLMDFTMSKLGTNVRVLESSFAPNQEDYTVEGVQKIGEKAVMCHRLNALEVVYYCHEFNATTSYMVPMMAADGTKAKALAVCHADTRSMNANVLYQALKVRPGTVPVCHFIGTKAVLSVPVSGKDNNYQMII